jgi:hypothetical protein
MGLPARSGHFLLAAALVAGGWLAPHPSAAAAAVRPVRTTVAIAARSSPVSLRIPALGLTASVGSVGLNPDRTVQVPKNPEHAGWYRFGPSPGQSGSAVILGHVDSTTGPAIFYRLGSLRAGNSIMVTLADGVIAHFEVVRVATYPNRKFPAGKVYRSTGPPVLTLVTCGGPYDHRVHAYTENVVVYASLAHLTSMGHHTSR